MKYSHNIRLSLNFCKTIDVNMTKKISTGMYSGEHFKNPDPFI